MVDRGPFLIIVNPVSGQRRALRMAEQVAQRIRECGACVEIRETTGKLSGQEIAASACNHHSQRPACVVACGGDGTIQEVANALAPLKATMGDQCPLLGVAPAGRCNDFATVLGIPRDPEAIADTLLEGATRPIDLGRVTPTAGPRPSTDRRSAPAGRYFCTVATLGVDAQVSSFVDRMRVPLRGTPAYVYGALRVLARYRPCHVHIEGDFGIIDRPVFLASTANTSMYGGAIPIVPQADPADGLLDLCVIDTVSRLRAFSMLPIVMAGRHAHRAGVTFLRTRRLTIDTPAPAELWADGERIGQTPTTIDIAPAAVQVIVPQGGGR